MKNFLIGIVSGLALYTLYIKTQKKRDESRLKQAEDNKRELLFDAKVDRKCECEHQYCTCGRHVL